MVPTRPENDAHSGGMWGGLWAVLRHRCPRCRKGQIYTGLLTMNDPCPVCGLVFRREEGYFLGAMYVSCALATAVLAPGYFLGTWLLEGRHDLLLLVGLFLLYLALTPFVVSYSRTIWIHFDRWACPTDVSAGAFQKSRERRPGP